MEPLQIALDAELFQATAGTKELSSQEKLDREGYLNRPQTHDEIHLWEAEAACPAL
jgi:hypothetical protein